MNNYRHSRHHSSYKPQQNSGDHRSYRGDRSRRGPRGGRRGDENEKAFLRKQAIDPSPRIVLEKGSNELTVRAMDLLCPIGMGQRGLIVAPPGSGKTTFLKHICQAVAKSQPKMKVYCLLVDERPEEVTDFKRSVPAEVHYSSMDEEYDHHVKVAEDLMKQVFVDLKEEKDVFVLIDSLTRLARVHNSRGESSGRTLSGGMDARAIEIPRRMFGAARNIDGKGSLTILATILTETGSRMDDVIFEEFKGTGNMEIILSRDISSQRVFPAIDIDASRTRREELLYGPDELRTVIAMRNALREMNPVQATRTFVEKLEKSSDNQSFLKTLQG